MKFSLSMAIAIATVSAGQAFAEEGRPVTANDLSGKKICWNNGGTTTFAADGQFTNRQGWRSSWSIVEPGLVKIGVRYVPYLILPDGRFYLHTFCGRCGSITGNHDFWGTVCN